MATIKSPQTWKTGFMEPSETESWALKDTDTMEDGENADYVIPPFEESFSSTVHNSLGLNVVRTWPTLDNGTESPDGRPGWWRPLAEVDVLICGAGPFGLEVALSLARQGVAFRIVDREEAPLLAGRADALHPRSLEILQSWGLGDEFHEEGPILNSAVMYKDGEKMFSDEAYQSDSRYRGIHIITQPQIERIYIRDLLRHKVLVERCTVLDQFEVGDSSLSSHAVQALLRNTRSGECEIVKAKFLVGAEGASSSIRKQLGIPFDGITTDIHWGILDCKFETDYPYLTTFSVIINAEHGGCIVIPREMGYTRIYTQISAERVKELAEDRREAGGRVDNHSITAEEVLEQTNRIFAPYNVKFSAPLSWFAVWKISERVARSFSSPDLRIHLGGDAAHVHSVMGAFGLNSSIYDASNLSWKLGLCARNLASLTSLLPTYDLERRLYANRVIHASGAYLRFVTGSSIPLAELRGAKGDELKTFKDGLPTLDGTRERDLMWCGAFVHATAMFQLGLELPHTVSAVCPPMMQGAVKGHVAVENGKRAPNPRICFDEGHTGYLYDKMMGVARFHILVFGSNMQGPVRERIVRFSDQALGSTGFFARFGGTTMFNVLLVLKALPHERDQLLRGDGMKSLRDLATVVYDDRAPDEDAEYWYGINHARGAVVAVRPDLQVGVSCWPEETKVLEEYFGGFLVDQSEQRAVCRQKLQDD